MLFWLVVIEKMRKDQLTFVPELMHIPMIILVAIYAILTLVLFTWSRLRAAEDPVYGDRDDLIGLIVMFYFTAAVYGILIIWLMIILALTIPLIRTKPYLKNRFLFLGIPVVVSIFSVAIGIFAGTFGPFMRNSLSFVYFLNMYNVYAWILTYATWPVHDSSSALNTTSYVPEELEEAEEEVRSLKEGAKEGQVRSLKEGQVRSLTLHDEL
eukprot:TRINITY_DN20148_c0_g1_i1.p1 TRINITY_DN20148_c0_g1~~TRINITY_DN20148_c0_g1_i1.p1  ORF type:complete len:211 (+),score=19.48 TRINITY_DN20148_c0_g1_i1:1-633(+)